MTVTLTDEDANFTGATQSYQLLLTNTVSALLGGNSAYVGFTAGSGGANATQVVTGFSYNNSSAPIASGGTLGNTVVVAANATIDVGLVSTTFPLLQIGNATLTATNAAGDKTALTFGAVSFTGSASGFQTGLGARLNLGALNDNGVAQTVTFSGSGETILAAPATSLVNGTQFNITSGTLYVNDNGNNIISLGAGTLAVINVSAGATFGIPANDTVIGALSGAGVVQAFGSQLFVGSSNNLSSTFSGTIVGGGGNFIKGGTGSLTLTGSSTSLYQSVLNAGTLVAANGASGFALGASSLTLSGGTLAAGAAGGTLGGPVLAGSSPHTIAPGAGLPAGQYGTLYLNGGLTTNNYSTLAFNLGAAVSSGHPSGDLLVIGAGGLTIGASTAISFTNANSSGDYRLIGGNIGGSPALGNFVLPAAPPGDSYSLSATADPGFIDLVAVIGTPTFVNGVWIKGAGGAWSAAGNWSGGVPGVKGAQSANDTATFGTAATSGSTVTITLDTAPQLSALTFSSTSSYVLQGSGTAALTLSATSGLASVTVTSGSQTIAAPLTLASSADFAPAVNAELALAGNIGGTRALSLGGAGTLVLGGADNTFSGGTYADSGTLITDTSGAIPANTRLTIGAGGTFIYDPTVGAATAGGGQAFASPAGAAASVPEPGTLGLILAGLGSAALYGRWQQRRRAARSASRDPEYRVPRSR